MKLSLFAFALAVAAFPQEDGETAAAPAPGPPKGGAPAPSGGASLAGAGAVPGTLAVGPYKSAYWAEPSLPKHTFFGPISPPASLKMPVCARRLMEFNQNTNIVTRYWFGAMVLARAMGRYSSDHYMR